MPRVDGVLETSLYVDDLHRSTQFYQSIFGFEIIDTSERLHALRITAGQLLLLFKKRLSATLDTIPHDGEGQLHLAFAIPVTELADWEAWLHQHGIAIEEKKKWKAGGVSLYFRDPDQHLLEVATPGVWAGVY